MPAGATPAEARSRVQSVALIEAICVETDLTVSWIKAAAVSHLGVEPNEFVAEETQSGTLESARYSMAAGAGIGGSARRLVGMIVIAHRPKAQDAAQSCSISVGGEEDGRAARVDKFSLTMRTLQANHRFRLKGDLELSPSGHNMRGWITRRGRVLEAAFRLENHETADERLTIAISQPSAQ